MASLTDTLQTSGFKKPVVNTTVQQPDIFGTIADTADAFINARASSRSKGNPEAEARAAEKHEDWRQDEAAKNELARGAYNILSEDKAEAKQLVNAKNSGAISETGFTVRSKALVSRLMNKYEGSEYAIYQALSEVGLDDPLFRGIRAEEARFTAQLDEETATNAAFTKAATDSGINPALYTPEEYREKGRTILQAKAEIENGMKLHEYETAKNTANKALIDKIEYNVTSSVIQSLSPKASELTRELQSIIASAGSDEELVAQMMELGPQYQNVIQSYKLDALAKVSGFAPDQVERINSQFAIYENMIADSMSGDLSSAKLAAERLKFLEDSNVLLGHEVAPAYMALLNIAGPAGSGEIVKIWTQQNEIADELTGLVSKGLTDIVNGRQSPEALETRGILDTYQKAAEDPAILNVTDPDKATQVVKMRSQSARISTKQLNDNPDNVAMQTQFAEDMRVVSYSAASVPDTVATEGYVKNVDKILFNPGTMAALDSLSHSQPAKAAIIKKNLTTAIYNASEAQKRIASNFGAQFGSNRGTGRSAGPTSSNNPRAKSVAPTLVYNDKTGLYEQTAGQLGSTGNSRTYFDDEVVRLNKFLDYGVQLGDEVGIFPPEFKTYKEKRDFLASGQLSDEVLQGLEDRTVSSTPRPTKSPKEMTASAIEAVNADLRASISNNEQARTVAKFSSGLKQKIYQTESGNDYDKLYNNSEKSVFMTIKPTEMTIKEVLAFQDPSGPYAQYVAENNDGVISTPVGAGQVVGTTLRQAAEELGIPLDTYFTPEVQDIIVEHLIMKRVEESLRTGKPLNELLIKEFRGLDGQL